MLVSMDFEFFAINLAYHDGPIHEWRIARVALARHASATTASLPLIPRNERMIFADPALAAADLAISHTAIS
jgi:hypothetical protein